MKKHITILIAYACYWLGIDAFFYFLNRKAKRIITFHNVIPTIFLPNQKKIGLTDSENEFRMKVRIIKSRFSINTDITDTSSAVITFDDGYRNQNEIAGKILKEEGNIPAIIFVAGKMIDNHSPSEALIVDLLLHWTFLVPNGRYLFDVNTYFNITDTNRNELWQKVIWPLFCKDNQSKGRTLLHDLNKQYPIDKILASCNSEYLRLRLTGFSSNEIKEIVSNGWIVGWHTNEHYPLSKLTTEDKLYEIKTAPQEMKSVVFSYPYGELNSVDQDSINYVKDTGYPYAVSNVEFDNRFLSKYFIPRMMLDGNFYQCHMQLCGLKYFIQHRKLLPTWHS